MDKDTAKAAQEIAKAGGKALEVAEKVGAFLNKVVGDAVVELGGAVHDWARLFRYKNLLRLQDKVEEIHRERKLQGKSIPVAPRFAIPLLQAASQEDDESIQDMWAGLIANSTDPGRRLQPKKIFTEILSSIEPIDAQILKYLSSQGWLMHRNVPNGGITLAKIQSALGNSEDDIRLSLQNLHRLGCIIDEYEATWDQIDTTSFGQRITDPKTTFRPSPLGFSLLKACDPKLPETTK
ncbi:MAG: Abi-alpha family protein [Sulfuricaulis sp.]|uniref:Abi-alpha family protein n=1 Tax=Sulfuricaulis sp. TaxID=2003553 RepID=UPI0034A30F96